MNCRNKGDILVIDSKFEFKIKFKFEYQKNYLMYCGHIDSRHKRFTAANSLTSDDYPDLMFPRAGLLLRNLPYQVSNP
jgi:hypothetical protein